MRMGIFLAMTLVACGGKVLDGTCTSEDAGSEWSCVDASGIPPVIPHCPAGFVPVGGACSNSFVGEHPIGGSGGNFAADCLDCGGNGIGTYWTCTGQGWKAAGSYACSQ